MAIWDDLKYDGTGLIPAVVQDSENGQVLMVAYMNEASVRMTLETRRVTFWSRSRGKFWIKGESSGNVQQLVSLAVDCDKDCLLVAVRQEGPACHEGYRSCFFREATADGEGLTVVAEQLKTPEEIYGAKPGA